MGRWGDWPKPESNLVPLVPTLSPRGLLLGEKAGYPGLKTHTATSEPPAEARRRQKTSPAGTPDCHLRPPCSESHHAESTCWEGRGRGPQGWGRSHSISRQGTRLGICTCCSKRPRLGSRTAGTQTQTALLQGPGSLILHRRFPTCALSNGGAAQSHAHTATRPPRLPVTVQVPPLFLLL